MGSKLRTAGMLGACLPVLGLPAIRPALAAPKYTVVYAFGLSANDGFGSPTGLTLGRTGALFGVTQGGPAANGTVFEIVPPVSASGAMTEVTVYGFQADNRLGTYVSSPLIQDATGVLIGSSFYGGNAKEGAGTVFTVSPPASQGGSWTGQLVHEFAAKGAPPGDGVYPSSSVLRGLTHQLYGITLDGGACNMGAAYQLTYQATPPSGYGWTESLFSFPCNGGLGSHPSGHLVAGQGGGMTLYGSATGGGAFGYGAIFRLVPPATPRAAWGAALIHSFAGGTDGGYPAGIISDRAGGFFGVIRSDPGSIFHLSPPATAGAAWTNAILHTFAKDGVDGWQPNTDLYLSGQGELFGTTQYGGSTGCGNIGCGAIFKLSPPITPGGAWQEAILYRFGGAADGGFPLGGLVRDKCGSFFGTASDFGPFKRGVVFKFLP